MERITSFSVDHRKLTKGVYVSRIDGDLITYDIRMTQPNVEPAIKPEASLLYTSPSTRERTRYRMPSDA